MPQLVKDYQASGKEDTLEAAMAKMDAAYFGTPEHMRRHFEELIRWPPLGQIGYLWFWKLKGYKSA